MEYTNDYYDEGEEDDVEVVPIGKGGYGEVVAIGNRHARKMIYDQLSFIQERAAHTLLKECRNVVELHDSDLSSGQLLLQLYQSDLRWYMNQMWNNYADHMAEDRTPTTFTPTLMREMWREPLEDNKRTEKHSYDAKKKRKETEQQVRSRREKWIQEGYLCIQLQIAADICVGLHEIHARGCLHCDLTARNVFLKQDPSTLETRAVLGDLGLLNPARFAPIHNTTAKYREPDPKGDTKHDIWSLGLLLAELFAGLTWPSDPVPYEMAACDMEEAEFPHPLLQMLTLSMVDVCRESRPAAVDALQVLYKVGQRMKLKVPCSSSAMNLLQQHRAGKRTPLARSFGFTGSEAMAPRLLRVNVREKMVQALERAQKQFVWEMWGDRPAYGHVLDAATLGLARFLHSNSVRTGLRHVYCCATLVLLSAIYHWSNYPIKIAIQHCGVPEHVFHTVLNDILRCRPFIEEVFLLRHPSFSPSSSSSSPSLSSLSSSSSSSSSSSHLVIPKTRTSSNHSHPHDSFIPIKHHHHH